MHPLSALAVALASLTAGSSRSGPKNSLDKPVFEGNNATASGEAHVNDIDNSNATDPARLGVDKVQQYSGYMSDHDTNKHMFYWFFESRNDPEKDPVILWLQGGPGCSSLPALFMGMGPSRIDAEGQMLHNEYSWNSNASLIFLDQPVNTGFSYSNKRINNTITAAQDVYRFLAQFFEKYPQYGKQDLHIAGEGYAGRFIPVLAAEIANREEDNLVHLKSVMIGNGIVDPYTQYPKYLPMGCGKGGHAAIYKPRTCRRFSKIVKICQTWIRHCYIHGHSSCINAAAYCDAVIIGGFARRSRTNIRDIRRPCDGGTACYAELGHIKSWLNRPDVMRALGANADAFELCSAKVEREFRTSGDGFMPYYRYVPGVLDETPVLVYAGDKDYMANWLGSEAWTHALDWAGHDDFNKSNSTEMREMQSGEVYGTLKHARGLAFLRVYDAGHIVPLDRPRSALDFVNRWLRLPGFEELGPS